MKTTPSSSQSVPRPSVIQFPIPDLATLAAAYMPLLIDGGIFIQTNRDYQLGDSVYVLLSLPDDPERYPVATKVVWVTPPKAAGGRVQGVGIRFPKDEKSLALKAKIEAALSAYVGTDRATQTI